MKKGHGAPDVQTVGNVGDFYEDLDTGKVYKLIDVVLKETESQFVTRKDYVVHTNQYIWSDVNPLDALLEKSITEVKSNATSIGQYAFSSCAELTTANFPAATSVGDYGFSDCSKLTTANFPAATSIGQYAFINCSKLTTADFPAATSIGQRAFSDCSKLTTANFPAATSVGDYAFYSCAELTTANFPAATSIGKRAFQSCSKLTTADFPAATSIVSSAFQYCNALTAVILRSETMATLLNTNAFSGTPIEFGTGYFYVPRALLSDADSTKDYRQGNNWFTYRVQFRVLEDYTVDGTITGALDPAKVGG